MLVAATILSFALAGCAPASRDEVVVYTSVDQVFAEPVFEAFSAKTGVRVRAVYDAEAAKTTGLVNRLIAEKDRPRADVWWSGEIAQTFRLAEEGVLAPHGPLFARSLPGGLRDGGGRWAAIGGRLRVFLYNTRAKVTPPRSLDDLSAPPPGTDPARIAMANPVFGTSSTQAAVLYSWYGREDALAYYRAVRDAGVRIVAGNGDVRDLVASGELDWGLTDSDDALGAIAKGAPVRVIVPGPDSRGHSGSIVIPNTIGVVAGGPNRTNAARLVAFLLSPEAERLMVEHGWIQVPSRGAPDARISVAPVEPSSVSWGAVARQVAPSAADMRELFIR